SRGKPCPTELRYTVEKPELSLCDSGSFDFAPGRLRRGISGYCLLRRCDLKGERCLDFARHDKRPEHFRKERFSRGGVPALPCQRAKCFAAHAESVSPGANCFRRGE